jgi:hypothetical protein
VLSDPDLFDKALKSRRSAVNLRGQTNGHGVYPNAGPAGSEDRSPKGKSKGKKSKKERDAKAREAIEKSWDIPPPSPASYHPDPVSQVYVGPARLLSPPIASPENGSYPHTASEMKTPTMTARATLAHVASNGVVSPPHKGKNKAMNGHAKLNGAVNNAVDAELVGESVIAALEAQPHPIGKVEKRQFTQEVLTLIHVRAYVFSRCSAY